MHQFKSFMPRRTILQLGAAIVTVGTGLGALAQSFPSRALKIVVGSPPGALGDVLSRLIGQKFTDSTGQPALVDNRLGAGGTIAATQVAKAQGDGYTVLLAPDSVLVFNPYVYPKLGYDPAKDFQAVALLGKASLMLAVSPNLKVKNFAEFIQLAKSQPKAITYGSGGSGHPTHVIMELIANRTGIQMTHVPYKGTSPAMQGLLAGEIGAMIVGMAEGMPQVKVGKAIPIAVSGPMSREIFPTLPELKEVNPDMDVSTWFGVFAPASTPRDVVLTLNAEINKALGNADVKKRLADFGLSTQPSSPAELDRLARSDRARFGPLIQSLRLTVE